MGTVGLTCPQTATYRGSVGVEPAVSCCAPGETLLAGGFWPVWFLGRRAGPAAAADLPVDLSTSLISSNRSHSSEQADVPAEQPSPAQEARLPSSDAHPCGPRDHRLPSQQGPSAPRGLSRLPNVPVTTSCCPRRIGSAGPTTTAVPSVQVGGRPGAPWWSICCPRLSLMRPSLPVSDSW